MIWAFAIHEVTLFQERFVSDTVESFVFFLVDIARFFASAPHLLCRHLVMRVGRSDEMEFRMQVELLFQLLELRGVLIRIRLGVFPTLLCFAIYLQSVLIGARVEKHFIAQKRTVSGDNVRLHHFKSEADMGIGVHVRKGRGDIKSLLHGKAQYTISLTFLLGHHAPSSYVLRQFLYRRRYRDRQKDSEESGELSAY